MSELRQKIFEEFPMNHQIDFVPPALYDKFLSDYTNDLGALGLIGGKVELKNDYDGKSMVLKDVNGLKWV